MRRIRGTQKFGDIWKCGKSKTLEEVAEYPEIRGHLEMQENEKLGKFAGTRKFGDICTSWIKGTLEKNRRYPDNREHLEIRESETLKKIGDTRTDIQKFKDKRDVGKNQ